MKICVFGSASYEIDKEYVEKVEALGEMIAKRGHSLVFGAGGNGLMGAAARGVHRGGGKIYGVIPHFFKEEEIEEIFDKCTELIFTDTMAQRKAKMEEIADAFITVPGGIGTFEEFFEVLTLKQLGRHKKAIAIYDVRDYYAKLGEFMDITYEEKFVKESCQDLYYYHRDAEKILDYIENEEQIERDVHDLKIG